MLLTFKRDDEGRERIYVGDVCVAHTNNRHDIIWQAVTHCTGVTQEAVDDAIERADEAGFWEESPHEDLHGWRTAWKRPNEVTVDVPVAVLSVTREGDES